MRRALAIGAWTVGSLMVFVALFGAAVLIAGNTAGGRAMIERLTSRLTAGRVQVKGLSGAFPAVVDLAGLQLRDEHGIWLSAERISLRWSPLALLARHVKVDSLLVRRLQVQRAPVTEKSTPHSNVPRIDVTRVFIDALELGPQLTGVRTTLSVRGSVHLRSLEEAAASLVAHRTDGNGDYDLQLEISPARMDASLKLEEPAGGPLQNLLQLPALGRLSGFVGLNGPRTAEQIKLSIDAGALHAQAQGSVNLAQPAADLEYSLEAPAMEPRPGLAWQHVALRGSWRGPLAAPAVDGQFQVEQLQLPGGPRLAALSANLTAQGGTLALHAVLNELRIPGPQPQLLEGTPLTVDASIRLNEANRPVNITATHRLFSLRARALTVGQQSATIDLRLPDLTPLAALGGADLRGDATVTGHLTRHGEATRVDLDASVGLRRGKAFWDGVLGDKVHAVLSAQLSEKGVDIERMQLAGRALTLSMSGTAGDAFNASWELKLSDLAALSPALAGAADASGQMKGPRAAFNADAQITSPLSVRGSPRGTVSASLHARGLPAAPSARLEAHGSFDGAPLQVDATVERVPGAEFRAVIRRAEWKSLRASGEIASGAAIARAQGRLTLSMGQLADLQRVLGTSLQGSLSGSLAMAPSNGRTRAQLQLEAHNVVAGGLAANAQLTATGSTDALGLQLTAQFPALQGGPATLSSTALLNLASQELKIESAHGAYHGQPMRLLAPAQLSYANGLTINGLKIGAREAVLELQGRLTPQLDAQASLHNLKPALINEFIPDLLDQGTIQAQAQLTGSRTAPFGRVSLDATGMRLKNDAVRDLAAFDIHAAAKLTGTAAQVDAKLDAGSASQLILSGSAPLTPEGLLNLNLAGKLDVGVVNSLIEAHGWRAAGQLGINATVTGSAATPDIHGTILLTQGDLRAYSQGVHLANITARIDGSQEMLRITSLSAQAGSGNLSMTGTIGLLQHGLPLDLKLTAKNAQPIASNIVTANLDADLHMTGTARERLDVAGTIHLNRTMIGIPNSLPPNVAVLDVRRPGQAPPPSDKKLVIGLDVSVQAPRQILVQGRGLDAELGGEVHLSGTTDVPIASGGFDLQRGTFTLASSKLYLDSTGRVSFNGAGLKNTIDPTLDFSAQTTAVDAKVILSITGPADAPQFDLTSTPQMPQDEIMARLLFGESAAQLTALQVAQIGTALATLSGGGGGFNPLAKIQKTLGLDRLAVGAGTSTTNSTENAGATIEAGRYVSSRVFVGAKQGTTGTSQLEVDVDLSKKLKLQTRLGNGTATAQGTTPENDPGSSIGLSYQFEY